MHRVLVISSIHTKCRNMESLLIMSHKIWLLFTNVWGLRWYLKNYGKYQRVFQLVFLDLPIKIKKPRIDWDKNNFANTKIFSFYFFINGLLSLRAFNRNPWYVSFFSLNKYIEEADLVHFWYSRSSESRWFAKYLWSTFLLFEFTILVHFEEEKSRPKTFGPKLRTNSNTWSWIAQILFWTKI